MRAAAAVQHRLVSLYDDATSERGCKTALSEAASYEATKTQEAQPRRLDSYEMQLRCRPPLWKEHMNFFCKWIPQERCLVCQNKNRIAKFFYRKKEGGQKAWRLEGLFLSYSFSAASRRFYHVFFFAASTVQPCIFYDGFTKKLLFTFHRYGIITILMGIAALKSLVYGFIRVQID
ncbi:hypothetical protein V8C35DRAFT_45420 [Trichoderma chlorosporum]